MKFDESGILKIIQLFFVNSEESSNISTYKTKLNADSYDERLIGLFLESSGIEETELELFFNSIGLDIEKFELKTKDRRCTY
jgi:hypothetical protein